MENRNLIEVAKENLVKWLESPMELGIRPSEIEHLQRVPVKISEEGHETIYYVFKFKTEEPHWAAKNSWMLGVTGPYFEDGKDEKPLATFSRLTKEGDITPADEAQWVHENIALKFR